MNSQQKNMEEGGLTEEEQAELKQHPVPTTPRDAAHLSLRQRIAVKIDRKMMELDTTLTPEFRAAYDLYPRYKFYSQRDNPLTCRRAFGVMIYEDKSIGLHMVTRMLGWCNRVVGGVPASEVVAQDSWTDEQHDSIVLKSMGDAEAAAVFLDPLGWVCLI
jgi:hypothetical protein